MPMPEQPRFRATDLDALAAQDGTIAVTAEPGRGLPPAARRANRLTRGAVARLVDSARFDKLAPGDGVVLEFPTGMAADRLVVLRLSPRPTVAEARRAGAMIGASRTKGDALIALSGPVAGGARLAALVLGAQVRGYTYTAQKSDAGPAPGGLIVMTADPESALADCTDAQALAEGVWLTRDLVNAPANVLTTESFATQLAQMTALGLQVQVLDEPEMEALGMGALLAVGRGSECPSKLVVLRWQGGGDAPTLAVCGKGVMFDTGGISIKPAAGMESMTMDMGGAAVTAGLMHALARRRARANVVGLVGLVENMPDGRAQRPGDVIRSMKGDTIEVINTDAEGRLVLADVLWYAQEKENPGALVDLATLTGAVIIALGHEKAGVFANDDALAAAMLSAADATGEGAWRLPLDPAYDKLLKSRIADMKNTGGRAAGSITAAQFLQRFVRTDMPWVHLDIAGVALVDKDTALAPKGATGWGVMALDELVRARFERRD